jgi:probable rRNA maturation factor
MIQTNLFIGARYPVNRKAIRSVVESTLARYGITSAQVDVSVVGARKIKTLNEQKLQHHGETDVLSFPQHERHQLNDFPLPEGYPPHLGDIVVSFPEAVRAAARFGKRVDEQIGFYVEHGLLHLLGYHHE